MSSVTGSKQFRSIVVQDRPGRRRAITALIAAGFLLCCWVFFVIGGHSHREELAEIEVAYQQLQEQHAQVTEKFNSATQELTNQQMGSEVDRQAVEDIRAVVREHKQTITELSEEITFYKGLMAPTDRERGLSIRSWEVYPTADLARFQYKLVVQQLAVKHAVLAGSVSVVLVGQREGVEESYTLSQLSEQVKSRDIRLRFKYFQTIDGELSLPPGFEVSRIDIVAKATKPKSVKVEKHYGWIVQSGNA